MRFLCCIRMGMFLHPTENVCLQDKVLFILHINESGERGGESTSAIFLFFSSEKVCNVHRFFFLCTKLNRM